MRLVEPLLGSGLLLVGLCSCAAESQGSTGVTLPSVAPGSDAITTTSVDKLTLPPDIEVLTNDEHFEDSDLERPDASLLVGLSLVDALAWAERQAFSRVEVKTQSDVAEASIDCTRLRLYVDDAKTTVLRASVC